jgi:hypothetical protein
MLRRCDVDPADRLVEELNLRDPEAIEAWAAANGSCHCQTAGPQAAGARAEQEVYFRDESGFRADTMHGKTWGKKRSDASCRTS